MNNVGRKKRAVFLDRDGVINEDCNYTHKVSQLRLILKADEAIKILNDLGFLTVVATNQAGIAYGLYHEDDMHKFHQALSKQLAKKNARIDAFYFCPHHPQKGLGVYKIDCACRKPKIGMFTQAAADLQINLKRSFIIGDKWSDIEAGQKCGLKTVMVRTGHGQKELKKNPSSGRLYDYLGNSLYDAVVKYIIKE